MKRKWCRDGVEVIGCIGCTRRTGYDYDVALCVLTLEEGTVKRPLTPTTTQRHGLVTEAVDVPTKAESARRGEAQAGSARKVKDRWRARVREQDQTLLQTPTLHTLTYRLSVQLVRKAPGWIVDRD